MLQALEVSESTLERWRKLYGGMKSKSRSADMLNDRVVPFFEEQEIPLLRVLTDRGTEYCGVREHHEYELYLTVENMEHTRTKAKSPQTNGICERFHKTILEEFYQVAFRKKLYESLEALQADLDQWIDHYDLPPGSEPIVKLELGMFDLHPNLDPVGMLGIGLLR